MKRNLLIVLWLLAGLTTAKAQPAKDSVLKTVSIADSSLRIKNLNPYFTLHVDSTLRYQLEINREITKYYWFLKNGPVGLKINKGWDGRFKGNPQDPATFVWQAEAITWDGKIIRLKGSVVLIR